MQEMYNLTFVCLKNFVLLYSRIPDSAFRFPLSAFRFPLSAFWFSDSSVLGLPVARTNGSSGKKKCEDRREVLGA